jgi:hypothetical protein
MNFGGWSTASIIALIICVTIAIGCSNIASKKKGNYPF